jgi:hypothetical protein
VTIRQLDGEFSTVPVENGSAAAPSIYFKDSGTDTGLFSPGADQVAISTGGTGRLFIDSSGRLLVGTSSSRTVLSVTPALQVEGSSFDTASMQLTENTNDAQSSYFTFTKSRGTAIGGNTVVQSGDNLGQIRFTGTDGTGPVASASISAQVDGTPGSNDMPGRIVLATTADGASSPTERMRIDSAGNVGIGTTSPGLKLHIQDGALASAPTPNSNCDVVIEGTTNTGIQFLSDTQAQIRFGDAASTGAGSIIYEHSGNLLKLNHNNSGATTFNNGSGEIGRFDGSGRFLVGKTAAAFATSGTELPAAGGMDATRNGNLLSLNRLTTDGSLVDFFQDTTKEGSISVSGTTVSYNGAHLSRWSQLPSGAERIEILRGSVLSNIDEMCEWSDEENEQLNRMKVSTVEGDKNVSGVFQAWDDDDDTYTNDFYCAMTGDFIIRIGAGTNVERGDLLMSAGDGTAKPQDDDIIRSKTIAKVTSTNVSCTYEDGSYCVPCVLMAC